METAAPSPINLTHIRSAAPGILQWLKENYELQDGHHLLRSEVYDHYLACCEQLSHPPVHAAILGKLMRVAFPGLQIRRLGTRKLSKYHYIGLKRKEFPFPNNQSHLLLKLRPQSKTSTPNTPTPVQTASNPAPASPLLSPNSLFHSISDSALQLRNDDSACFRDGQARIHSDGSAPAVLQHDQGSHSDGSLPSSPSPSSSSPSFDVKPAAVSPAPHSCSPMSTADIDWAAFDPTFHAQTVGTLLSAPSTPSSSPSPTPTALEPANAHTPPPPLAVSRFEVDPILREFAAIHRRHLQQVAEALLGVDMQKYCTVQNTFWETLPRQYAEALRDPLVVYELECHTAGILAGVTDKLLPDPLAVDMPPLPALVGLRNFLGEIEDRTFHAIRSLTLEFVTRRLHTLRQTLIGRLLPRVNLAIAAAQLRHALTNADVATALCNAWSGLCRAGTAAAFREIEMADSDWTIGLRIPSHEELRVTAALFVQGIEGFLRSRVFDGDFLKPFVMWLDHVTGQSGAAHRMHQQWRTKLQPMLLQELAMYVSPHALGAAALLLCFVARYLEHKMHGLRSEQQPMTRVFATHAGVTIPSRGSSVASPPPKWVPGTAAAMPAAMLFAENREWQGTVLR